MIYRPTLCVFWIALAVGGCGEQLRPDPRAEQFLGLHAINVLQRPTRIEGFNYRAPDGTNLGNPLPKTLDLAIARDLREVLFNDRSYSTSGGGESFVRDASFRISSDRQTVEVHLSFRNDLVQIYTNTPGGKPVVQHGSFAPAHDRMLLIVQRALPDFKLKR